jgi:hypothetical protein
MGQLYELGIYDLAYEIVPISTPCMAGGKPRTLLAEFKKLPGGSSESAQIAKLHEVFEDTFTWSGSEVGSHFSNVTQELTYTLTNSLYGYLNGPLGMWDTDATAGWKGGVHPDGLYSILIHASDIDGNATVNSFTVELDNGLGFNGYCLGFIPVDGPKWVHPIEIVSLVSGGSFSIPPPPSAPMQFAAVGQDRIARATVSAESWPVWSFDVPEAGERVHIGMLSGQLAEIEYDPVLGDVVVHAPVEVQTEPMAATGKAAGGFDPGEAPVQPIDLHYTTRLVRDPASGEALVGGPMGPSGEFKLVLAEQILVGNAPFVIRTPGTGGVEASIEQIAAVPALSVWSRVILGLLILSATTSLGFAARRGVVSERG